MVEIYYPPMEVIVAKDFCLDDVLAPFDTYIYSEFYRRPTGFFQFGDHFASGPARSLFLFHGHSDKFRDLHWIEQLAGEDIVLVYGPQFYEWMCATGIVRRIRHHIFCGNYRLEFYKQNREFFKRELKGKKRVLYAPTWSSPVKSSGRSRHYSNVVEVYEGVKEALCDYDLYIKLHPYFEKLMPQEAQRIKGDQLGPVIYSILEETDIFLGDYSSIAYDFLYFERPICLFGWDKPWATQVSVENLREKIERPPCPGQKEAYTHAYGEKKSLETLRKEILDAY
ncbi:MAG: CDP-glycerol glycerophosphotransferase family protein [Chlamydiales bacterium]|nr:CDP-glycerol glycerophosphotransferase family protein [Chlamydiales bacterium]